VHAFGSEELDELAEEAQRQARSETAADEARKVEEEAAR